MRMGTSWLVGGTFAAALAAPAFGVVTWSYVGTSGYRAFTTTYPNTNGIMNRPIVGTHPIADTRRVKTFSVAVDAAGNAFATCSVGNNTTSPGGVTMFPAGGGTPVDFNVSSIEYGVAGTNTVCPNRDEVAPCPKGTPGGYVTKLIIGGDGRCYGLQHYNEMGSNGSFYGCCGQTPSRILRFNTSGSIDVIVEYSPIDGGGWHRIAGMTRGGDGHIYYQLGGPLNGPTYDWDGSGPDPAENQYHKRHLLWRYNILTQQIEESPTSAFATRPQYGCRDDETNGVAYNRHPLEWIGRDASNVDYFGIIDNNCRDVDRKAWLTCRDDAALDPNADGRRLLTHAVAFDRIRQKLWVGSQSQKSGTNGDVSTNLFTRFNGTPGTGTFSSVATSVWHANGNNTDTGTFNGSPYWVSALTVNEQDGRGWMAYSAHVGCQTCGSSGSDGDYLYRQDYAGTTGALGKLGFVYTVSPDHINDLALYLSNPAHPVAPTNEGRPMDALTGPFASEAHHENFVVALTFAGGKVYALCLSLVNGRYHLFSGTVGNCNTPGFDADGDGDVDSADFGKFQECYLQPVSTPGWTANCYCFDKDGAPGVGDGDFTKFRNCSELSTGGGNYTSGGQQSRDKVPAVAGCDQ